MFIVFSMGVFQVGYVPTVFQAYVADIDVDGKHVDMILWDTARQEEYVRRRPLTFPDTTVVIICFSIAEPHTLNNVQEKVGFILLKFYSN
jgi:GTPase SAR1 family protein